MSHTFSPVDKKIKGACLVRPHGRDGVALHQDIAASQQLQRLERCALGAQQPLPPLHKLLLQSRAAHHCVPVFCDLGIVCMIPHVFMRDTADINMHIVLWILDDNQ